MNIEQLDLNLLVTLDTLLAERNVTHAARRLNLSQPALSARLTRLRDLLNDPLLLPSQRGMIPTERALELQAPLHQAIESVRRVIAETSPFNPADITATIAIAASDYVQYSVLLPLLQILHQEAPSLRLSWRTLEEPRLDGQMARGDIHLAVTMPECAPETLHMRHLYHETYVAIARPGHPDVKDALDLETFCALDHVMVSPDGGGFSGPTDAALAGVGKTRRVCLSAPGFLVVPDIIAQSDMIALIPSRVARNREGRLQILEPPLPIPGFDMALIWHDRTTTHPLHRWLRDRIYQLMRDIAPTP